MARISGVDIQLNKELFIALTAIYGIGIKTSKDICNNVGLDGTRRVKDLTDNDIITLRSYIDKNLSVEGELKKVVNNNIKRLQQIGCYRGLRHRYKLPSRGQRTHTNANTRRKSR